MAIEKERIEFEVKGQKLVLVHEHQRALPGEGGSDYKPVNVREHLRQIDDATGKERAFKTGFAWEPGEMSSALILAMAEVLKIDKMKLPSKNWRWTLKEATYVLSYEMRYDRWRKVWHRGSFCWSADVNECMDKIDRRLAKKAAREAVK